MIPTSVRPAQVMCTGTPLGEQPVEERDDSRTREEEHRGTPAASLALLRGRLLRSRPLGWRGGGRLRHTRLRGSRPRPRRRGLGGGGGRGTGGRGGRGGSGSGSGRSGRDR